MSKWKILLILLIGIYFINGGIQVNTKDLLPLAPSVDIEATVISLYLDESYDNYTETVPKDRAIIIIDSVDLANDPNYVINIHVNDKINAFFKYSARPAKLIREIAEIYRGKPSNNNNTENEVDSHIIYDEQPKKLEDGYIIYRLSEKYPVSEINLSGVEEGHKIKFKIFSKDVYPPETKIINEYKSVIVGIYEIIP